MGARSLGLLQSLDITLSSSAGVQKHVATAQLEMKGVCQPHLMLPWLRMCLSCVSLSAGELAGLHGRAGAPRAPGPAASAQTASQAAARRAGQGAADRAALRHVRAPESRASDRSATIPHTVLSNQTMQRKP